MPPFSADTNGPFDLMGFPAGEESVRKIKTLKPAIVALQGVAPFACQNARAACAFGGTCNRPARIKC
jgi:hypothetical protein